MKARGFIFGADYPEICEWWRGHGWPELAKGSLSKIGFVAEDETGKHAACWLYLTGTAYSVLEWFVVNPKSGPKAKIFGLEACVVLAKQTANECGATLIHTSTKSSAIIKLLKKHGFVGGDEGLSTLIFRGGLCL